MWISGVCWVGLESCLEDEFELKNGCFGGEFGTNLRPLFYMVANSDGVVTS